VNYGDVQRRSMLAVIGLMFAMTAGALVFGVIPLRGEPAASPAPLVAPAAR
jgi:hypothetical protein